MTISEHGNVKCDRCNDWMPAAEFLKGYIGPADPADIGCPFTEFVAYCETCAVKV